MKIYDITQEVFGCVVFPGDSAPEQRPILRMAEGDFINLSDFSMCAHNGTHIDAPFHFFKDGKTVEAISLDKTVGNCYVAAFDGEFSEKDAELLLEKAGAADPSGASAKKLLFKGTAVITPDAAKVFAAHRVELVGVESQTVGDPESPIAVHEILLGCETVLLEGVRLEEVDEGVYFLSAAPLPLGGLDGAPCRAVLIG